MMKPTRPCVENGLGEWPGESTAADPTKVSGSRQPVIPGRREAATRESGVFRVYTLQYPGMIRCRKVMIASPDLRNRRDDARDVLRARQTVIAILNHRQHHVIAG